MPSVTATTVFAPSAGVISTVTPGRSAPVVSRAVPRIVAASRERNGKSSGRKTATIRFRMMSPQNVWSNGGRGDGRRAAEAGGTEGNGTGPPWARRDGDPGEGEIRRYGRDTIPDPAR